jgi:Leucine-rich repeat (LRR) protein
MKTMLSLLFFFHCLTLRLFFSGILFFLFTAEITDISLISAARQPALLSNPSLSTDQFNALWDLYNYTSGSTWNWANVSSAGEIWNFTKLNPNPCFENWQGIKCSCSTECDLTHLKLVKYGLKGTLPASIGMWNFIEGFNLSQNAIKGTIPNTIRNWTAVSSFYLYENVLSGSIPTEIGNCRKLANLELYSNLLSNSIPSSIGNLSLLTSLNLYENLLNGTIPFEIGHLKELTMLDLDTNNLTGTIPPALGNLIKLTGLYLYDNSLTGRIPVEFANLAVLNYLGIYENYFNGTIPYELGNLTELLHFNLHTNNFTGSIPASIGRLSKLTYLNVGYNALNGTIPASICNLTALTSLYLHENSLTGRIPVEIENLGNLVDLGLYHNKLSGSIPSNIGNCKYLSSIDLDTNQLTGSIPSSIGSLTKLTTLHLFSNALNGTIPSEIFNLKELNDLELNANHLIGSISATIGNCSELYDLILWGNALTGSIPSEIGNLKKIQSVGFQQNNLIGSIPSSIGNLKTLTELYLFDNALTGTIPTEMGELEELVEFDFYSNFLSGTLPSQLFQLQHLISFDLSSNVLTGILFLNNSINEISPSLLQIVTNNNYFSGTLPVNLGMLYSLRVLIINSNQFSGTIPLTYHYLQNLQECFLQNNYFTGSIEVLLNTLSTTLVNIDLSNNEFTGSIASSFFAGNNNVSTFAAVANCLYGTIPQEICLSSNLTALALDGISTSNDCKEYILAKTIFNGFYPKYSVNENIPACLFAMPKLESLHLSGNGFIGSLSSNLTISSSLTNLSLSYNVLTGTIPDYIQSRSWIYLDLSYNKFTGTLFEGFFTNANSTLYLEVNRLSGTIPKQLQNMEAINILNGNIFQCNSAEELPDNDPSKATYSCASTSTDDFIFASIAIFGVIGILVLFITRTSVFNCDSVLVHKMDSEGTNSTLTKNHSSQPSLFSVFPLVNTWNNAFYHHAMENPKSNLCELKLLLVTVRRKFAFTVLIVMVVLLPVYSVLTVYRNSYHDEYAWLVSAVLLTGETAALVLFFAFLSFLLMIILVTEDGFVGREVSHKSEGQLAASINPPNSLPSELLAQPTSSCQKCIVYSLTFLVDISLFGIADFVYVFIVITYSVKIVNLAVVLLAGFKLFANNFVLRRTIPFISNLIKLFPPWCSSSTLPLLNDRKFHYVYTASDIFFLEKLMLFNNIILPIIAILIILPDCFYNVFFASPGVTSYYNYDNCLVDGLIQGENITVFPSCEFSSQETSYSPPFVYSYQCSSMVLINYAPVYIMKFILVGFLRPCYLLAVQCTHDYAVAGNVQNTHVLHCLGFLLPKIQKPLRPERDVTRSNIIYSKLSLTTQLSSYLAMVIVFGALFPPLAVVGCVAIFCMTYFEQLRIGRMLHESSQLGYSWYKEQLEEDCKGIFQAVHLSFRTIHIIFCFYCAYLLFDTWGDQEGWLSALPITILMATVPVVMLLFSVLFQRIRNRKLVTVVEVDAQFQNDSSNKSHLMKEEIELAHVIRNSETNQDLDLVSKADSPHNQTDHQPSQSSVVNPLVSMVV